MAKPKAEKVEAIPGNRRDRLASFEAARKKEQRRRNVGLLAICIVLALALLAYPIYLAIDDYRARTATIDQLGASLDSAGCDTPAEDKATGNQDHVEDGTTVTYAQHPPSSGPHYNTPAPFTKRFYTTGDRPKVETLVHNLEHGYTIAWYRDTMSSDQKKDLERIAKTFSGDDYTKDKFIAAPWNETDGAGFPAGKDVVLARWFASSADPGDTTKQKGIRQTCTKVSGAAVQTFMAKYPYLDSPEPNGG